MPIGVTQISTGQAAWSLIQFEVNVNTNSMIASFHSYDTSSRTSTVTMSIAFIKVSQHSININTIDNWNIFKINTVLIAYIRTEIEIAINTKENNIYISDVVSITLPSGFNMQNTVATASVVNTTWRWCNTIIGETSPETVSVRLFSGSSQPSATYDVGITLMCKTNQHSISRIDYGKITTGQVEAYTRILTTVEFEEPYSEAPEVFIQDVSPGGNVSSAINNKTIVYSVSATGFTASSFNNTASNFDSMVFSWLAIGKHSILQNMKLHL